MLNLTLSRGGGTQRRDGTVGCSRRSRLKAFQSVPFNQLPFGFLARVGLFSLLIQSNNISCLFRPEACTLERRARNHQGALVESTSTSADATTSPICNHLTTLTLRPQTLQLYMQHLNGVYTISLLGAEGEDTGGNSAKDPFTATPKPFPPKFNMHFR